MMATRASHGTVNFSCVGVYSGTGSSLHGDTWSLAHPKTPFDPPSCNISDNRRLLLALHLPITTRASSLGNEMAVVDHPIGGLASPTLRPT